MKQKALCCALLCLLALAGSASAVICTIDDVPAATLLLPYFEVDLGNPNGQHHAVLDQQRLGDGGAGPRHGLDRPVGAGPRLRHLPDRLRRADDQPARHPQRQPAADRVGRPGPGRHDQPEGRLLAGHQLRVLHRPAAAAARCRRRFVEPPAAGRYTGQSSPVLGNRCAGRAFGDNIARGYITVDTVNNCTLRFPGDPGYFSRPATPPTRTCSGATTSTSTRRRTSPRARPWSTSRRRATNPETSVAGQYTFYGRYVAWTAADHREPLATNFAARYINGGAFTGGTDLHGLARLEGQPGRLHLPGVPASGRPGTRWARKGS